MVYVLIVRNFIVLLKEKWENWRLWDDNEKFPQHKDKKIKVENKEEIGGTLEADPTRGANPFQKAMMDKCRKVQNDLFSVISIINISTELDFNGGLIIHNGKEPSVELRVKVKDVKAFEKDES